MYQNLAGELVEMVPPSAIFNPKWLNKSYSMDAIRMEVEATVNRIQESMDTIRMSCGQDAAVCLDVYLHEGLELSAAIRKHQQLEHVRQQEARRPVAAEQLDDLRQQLTNAPAQQPPAEPLTELYMDFRVYYTDKAQLMALRAFLTQHQMRYGRVPTAQ